MSEIKPWGFIHHSAKMTLRNRAYCNSTITRKSTSTSGMPLYTDDQLSQAIAAERERCAKVCEGERLEGVPEDPTDISYAQAVEHCIRAIRSAAK